MHWQNLNADRLIEYAIKWILALSPADWPYPELYGLGSPEKREHLRDHLTDTYAKLDPLLPPEGKFIRKWRLHLNVSPDELLSVVKT